MDIITLLNNLIIWKNTTNETSNLQQNIVLCSLITNSIILWKSLSFTVTDKVIVRLATSYYHLLVPKTNGNHNMYLCRTLKNYNHKYYAQQLIILFKSTNVINFFFSNSFFIVLRSIEILLIFIDLALNNVKYLIRFM